MNCRALTFQDLKAVEELEKRCFVDPWNMKMLTGSFLSGAFSAFVCEEDGAIVGYAGMTAVYEDGDLDRICVDPAHRGQGLGKALMACVIARAEELKLGKLFLEVRRTNESAIRLYIGSGFTQVGERKGYYGGGEDALVFCRRFNV